MALTQSRQVKEELERLTGDLFEMQVFKTQGDQQVEKPLWQMEGRDFFTKELDQALTSGAVDLVVHSYKDLSSTRPDKIALAAVGKRHYPQDILLIKKETIKALANKERLMVGTSAPRRTVNIKRYLPAFIPHGDQLALEIKTLRGNIDSRIRKLKGDDYDAIVLSLAGLERLARR